MSSKVSGPIRLADQVAAILSEETGSGCLVEGDKLPTEVELAEQLGVSRTVIREAGSRLRNAGFAEPCQGLGVVRHTPAHPAARLEHPCRRP